MTPTKRRLDFLLRRCCGLRPSVLVQLWHDNKLHESRAVQYFSSWAFAMAVLKLRCFKRFHPTYEQEARFLSCELFDMSDQEVYPCGLIRIPKLEKKVEEKPEQWEDAFDVPDEDMEHDDSDWY